MLCSQGQEVPRQQLQLLAAGAQGQGALPAWGGHPTGTHTPSRERARILAPTIQVPSPAGTQPAGMEGNRTTSLIWGRRKYQTVKFKN